MAKSLVAGHSEACPSPMKYVVLKVEEAKLVDWKVG